MSDQISELANGVHFLMLKSLPAETGDAQAQYLADVVGQLGDPSSGVIPGANPRADKPKGQKKMNNTATPEDVVAAVLKPFFKAVDEARERVARGEGQTALGDLDGARMRLAFAKMHLAESARQRRPELHASPFGPGTYQIFTNRRALPLDPSIQGR